MTVRLSFLLLALANLAFFAWAQGYFGSPDNGHEPLRLTQQLHPEKLRILREAPGSTVKPLGIVCRGINGLGSTDAEALKNLIEGIGVEAKLLPLREPPRYLAVIGNLAGKTAADRKAAELTRLGIAGHSTVALDNGVHEIILRTFESETAARDFMQDIANRGIKSARLDSREPPALKALVEARGPASTLLPQLPKLIGPYADASVGECAP